MKLDTISLDDLRDEYNDLENEREPYTDFLEANPDLTESVKQSAIALMGEAWDRDREERWKQLDDLFTEVTNADVNYMVAESYFVEYIRSMVEDDFGIHVPDFVDINWESTAENCKVDYSAVDFDGTTWYYR